MLCQSGKYYFHKIKYLSKYVVKKQNLKKANKMKKRKLKLILLEQENSV